MTQATSAAPRQPDLRLVTVGDIDGTFCVPHYQRGYRWAADDVRLLLDDIRAVESGDYCLQPVVVKRRPDGRWELIDGQQRLTTLYLIFRYMKQEGLKNPDPPFAIEYETRPQSAEFLAAPDEKKRQENIDFWHIVGAFGVIREWFGKFDKRRQLEADRFYMKLFLQVKVIWYEVTPDIDSTALFTRLNVGRIPLTDAELVKALFLTGFRGNAPATEQVRDRRQIEIGLQWDLIERELHNEAFWAFLTNRPGTDYPTRIELLFELLAGPPPAGERFHTFFHFKRQLDEGQDRDAIWEQILERHALLKEWHEDRDLYHKVGYLVATGPAMGDNLAALIRDSEGATKTAFNALLDRRIARRLNLTRDGIADLSYDNTPDACARVLLLFNVETTRRLKHSLDRYPFHVHKTERWSLEHIHAQNAEMLNKNEQWQAWLNVHAKYLPGLALPEAGQIEKRDQLVKDIAASVDEVTRELFDLLSARVIELFSVADALDEPHAIDNLALLSSGANSALGNAVFEVKRQRILEMDQAGSYIPICTRKVFFKYYSSAQDQQNQFWSRHDRERYREAMFSENSGLLTPYLKPSAGEAQ